MLLLESIPERLSIVGIMMSTSEEHNDDRHIPRFNRYNPSSCLSPGFTFPLVFVSPPQTIRTLPTSALAWPTRGLGTSPAVCSSVADRSRVDSRYRSFLTVSLTRPPNRNSSPVAVAVAGSACPYRGKGDGEGFVGGGTPGFGIVTGGGSCNRRCDHGYAGRCCCCCGCCCCCCCCCCC